MGTQKYRLHTKIQETIVYLPHPHVHMDGASSEDSDVTDEEDSDGIPELQSCVGASSFMELVIHHVLFVKNVFPKELFKRCHRNGIPFWICSHPDTSNYILRFLAYAETCLTKLKKLEILIILLRRKKHNVLEEFYFELKLNNSHHKSDSTFACHMDHLGALFSDIQNSSSFNAVHSGNTEITFELEYLFNMDTEIPEQDPSIPWIRYTGRGTALRKRVVKKFIPFKSYHNRNFQIRAHVIKREKSSSAVEPMMQPVTCPSEQVV